MKKKFLHLLGVVLLLLGTSNVWANPGDGWNEPIYITSLTQATTAGKYYEITAHHTIGAQIPLPTGVHINGGWYTITVGFGSPLFGALQSCELKNMHIHNSGGGGVSASVLTRDMNGGRLEDIRISSVSNVTPWGSGIGADAGTAPLVARATGVTIFNCRSSANVTGAGSDMGGLIGSASSCSISECFASGDVHQSGVGSHNSYQNVGGLLGHAGAGTLIRDCFALGDVTTDVLWGNQGTSTTAGWTCNNNGTSSGGHCTITNSTTMGNVTTYWPSPNLTDANTGGLVGLNQGTVNQCYYSGNVNATSLSSAFLQGAWETPGTNNTGSCTYFCWCSSCCSGSTSGNCDTCTDGNSGCSYATSGGLYNYPRRAEYVSGLVGQNTGSINTSYTIDLVLTRDAYPSTHATPTGTSWTTFTAISHHGLNYDVVSALTDAQGKTFSAWGINTTASAWTNQSGASYPLLQESLVNRIALADYYQGTFPLSTSLGTFTTRKLCSKNDWGEALGLPIQAASFLFTGSLNDFNTKVGGTLDYQYEYYINHPTNPGASWTNFVTSSFRPVSGAGGAGYASAATTWNTNRANDGVEPVAVSTKEGANGEFYIRVRAVGFPNSYNSRYAAEYGHNEGYDGGWMGAQQFHAATILPRPTVAWKGIYDAMRAYQNDWSLVQHEEYYNTICYDYRDVDLSNLGNPGFLGKGAERGNPDYRDSAYYKVELSGTPPFEYFIDEQNTSNKFESQGSWHNAVLNGDNTVLATGNKRKINAVPSGTPNNSRMWQKNGFNSYSSQYYYHIRSESPNSVNQTIPKGGSQPRYTGYNLILDKTLGSDPAQRNAMSTAPNAYAENGGSDRWHTNYSGVYTIDSNVDAQYDNSGYRVSDGNGCVSEITSGSNKNQLIYGIKHDLYADLTANSAPRQDYNYAYEPYDMGTAAPTTSNPYDTVIASPLPIMTFPYLDRLSSTDTSITYHGNVGMSTPRFHNDTVLCEGGYINPILFDSPLITNQDSIFNMSMFYAWKWVDTSDPNDTLTIIPAKYNPAYTEAYSKNPTNVDKFPVYTNKPFQGLHAWMTDQDADTIWNNPRTLPNENLTDMSDNPRPTGPGYNALDGVDYFPGFWSNDDHLKADSAQGLMPSTVPLRQYRDTVSRTWVRVVPYFKNVKGNLCYAKLRNLGYKDYEDNEYRGVTDYGITVNPRPNLFRPDTQIVCNMEYTKRVVLQTHIRGNNHHPGNAGLDRADTVWYSIYNFYPSMGWSVNYDSISIADVPRTRNGALNYTPIPTTNKGTPFDPAIPVGHGAFPFPSDSIPMWQAVNNERVPIYDTVRVIPYFKNRDSYDNICRGRADSVYYRILPTTTIVDDLRDTVVCNDNKVTLTIMAYGSNLRYKWWYRTDTTEAKQLLYEGPRQFYVARHTGYYSVDVIGDCGVPLSNEAVVILDDYPVFTKDLKAREQICEYRNTKLWVKVPFVKTLDWYYDYKLVKSNSSELQITNADPEKDYGYYQVKATSYCGRTTLSTLSRLWVVSELTPDQLVITSTDEFTPGKPEVVSVGYPFGFNDVTWYAWSYDSYNNIKNNAKFNNTEAVDLHSPTVIFNQGPDNGKLSVKMTHACATTPDTTYTAYKEIDIKNGTSISEIDLGRITVYPNPVVDELKIDSEENINKVTVTDAGGRVIYTVAPTNENKVVVKASNWTKGSYVISVETPTESVIRKVIKK